MLRDPAWRKRPFHTAWRYALFQVRKRVPALRRFVVPYDDGRARIHVDALTQLGYTLALYGHCDPDIDVLARVLRPGEVFIDGGAHVGLFTLVAASRVGPEGRVLSLEPAEGTRRLLAENVKLNGFDWVEIHAQALAEAPGAREFVEFSGEAWGSSSFAPPEELAGGRHARVETTTLDHLTASLDRSRVRLVKLDLEGAEHAALRGAEALLREARPDLLLEMEPEHLARQGTSAEAVADLLQGHGYTFFQALRTPDGGAKLHPVSFPDGPRERPNVYATARPDLLP